MQPVVAQSHKQAMLAARRGTPATGTVPHPARPSVAPNTAMSAPLISEKLTMAAVYCSQECLRQGCTLLATYKCTLLPFLATFRGVRPTGKKWSQWAGPLERHGAV